MYEKEAWKLTCTLRPLKKKDDEASSEHSNASGHSKEDDEAAQAAEHITRLNGRCLGRIQKLKPFFRLPSPTLKSAQALERRIKMVNELILAFLKTGKRFSQNVEGKSSSFLIDVVTKFQGHTC